MNATTTNTDTSTQPQDDAGVPPVPPEALHQAGAGEAQGGGVTQGQAADQDTDEGAEAGRYSFSGLSATYSPDDNKLRLYSMSRLDTATYERVKAAGFKWAPKQDLFVAPMWTPDREDLLTELCGEIDDEDTSLVERAAERAERFGDYSDNRGREAHAARRAVSAITDNIPLGQPILVGHHSERHARRDQERIENGMRRAVRLWDTSEYWSRRAAGALRHAKYKELPAVRHRRIKKIEADRRVYERRVAECKAALAAWQKVQTLEQGMAVANVCHLSHSFSLAEYPREAPASQYEGPMSLWSALDGAAATVDQVRAIALAYYPRAITLAQRWLDHFDNRLTYERAMLQEQGGLAADRFDIQVGGMVLVSGEWVVVTRVNKRDGRINSLTVNRRFVRVIGIEEVKEYQAPSAEAAAAVMAATKLPPLTNYPGEGVLEITQAQWDKVYKDHKRTTLAKATETTLAHRRREVDNFVARGLGHEPAKASQWGSTLVFIKDAKRVDPPAKPKQPEPQGAATSDEATPVATENATEIATNEANQDAIQAATTSAGHPPGPGLPVPSLPEPEAATSSAPRAQWQPKAPNEFDAMREQLRQGVKVVSAPQLFPTPHELARRMVAIADPQRGQRVLEPSSGTLHLLQALPFFETAEATDQRRQAGLDVVAVEINHVLAQLARDSGLAGAVHCRDFLEVTPDEFGERFDLVLMNPPFANAADIRHIEHAAKFLKPGGMLVAICAAGPRQHERLQPLVERNGGTWEPLPADTFAEAGTSVRTVLLSFTVPADEVAEA